MTGGGLEGRKFRRMEKARSDEGGEREQKNHSVSQFPLDNIHLFMVIFVFLQIDNKI